MPIVRYARHSRSVLRGANAAPHACSARRRPARPVDWTRLVPPTRPILQPDEGGGAVVVISLTVEPPPQ